jgi:hypothetical protein
MLADLSLPFAKLPSCGLSVSYPKRPAGGLKLRLLVAGAAVGRKLRLETVHWHALAEDLHVLKTA